MAMANKTSLRNSQLAIPAELIFRIQCLLLVIDSSVESLLQSLSPQVPRTHGPGPLHSFPPTGAIIAKCTLAVSWLRLPSPAQVPPSGAALLQQQDGRGL